MLRLYIYIYEYVHIQYIHMYKFVLRWLLACDKREESFSTVYFMYNVHSFWGFYIFNFNIFYKFLTKEMIFLTCYVPCPRFSFNFLLILIMFLFLWKQIPFFCWVFILFKSNILFQFVSGILQILNIVSCRTSFSSEFPFILRWTVPLNCQLANPFTLFLGIESLSAQSCQPLIRKH